MDRKNGLDYYNELYHESELTKAKAKAFDEIAAMFYNGNFGTATKSEIELKMFSILMDAMIQANKDNSGVLDYKVCSDFRVGHLLGIPQEKVRTLKIKKQARYPQTFKWTDSLMSLKNDIRYDERKGKIIIPMPDPNLYNAIRNFIEDKGGFIEIQRGNNVIQTRPEYFFILLYNALESDSDKETIRIEFVKQLKMRNEDDGIDEIKTDKELFDMALSYGEDFFDFAQSIAEGVANPLVGIIKCVQAITCFAKKKRNSR